VCVCACVCVCVCVCLTLSCFILVVALLKEAPRWWYLQSRTTCVYLFIQNTYICLYDTCVHIHYLRALLLVLQIEFDFESGSREWAVVPRASYDVCACIQRGETTGTWRPWHLSAQPVEADMNQYLRQTVCVQNCTATHCNTLPHRVTRCNTRQKGHRKRSTWSCHEKGAQTDLKRIQIHESWIVLYSFFLLVFVFIRKHVTTRWIRIGSLNYTASTNKTASVKDVGCVYDMHMCMCMWLMRTCMRTYKTLYIPVCIARIFTPA